MSDRERWTIYPLLFLALALGLRDKLFPPEPSAPPTTLALKQLSIVGSDNKPNIVLVGSDGQRSSAAIQIFTRDGKVAWAAVVEPKSGAALQQTGSLFANDIRILGTDGQPRVAITTDDTGTGRALIFDRHGKAQLLTGQPVDIKVEEIHSQQPAAPAAEQPEAGDATPEGAPPPDEPSKNGPAEGNPAEENPAGAEDAAAKTPDPQDFRQEPENP